ncbi:hypothetical protein BV25DRAFT_1804179 [Artomyces pyxidatus]|uniref:Uncharacterized protein n=1 Tax=Artomyces pyxidatus TaxID=48021 RepID=A0ACB8T0F7_9AGAM|nr:hypothetical protein BV25DRAFT_1804179 [Artomyces pyxidatus]
MSLLVVYNPASGNTTAGQYTTSTVLPLLAEHKLTPTKIASTEHPGHAGTIVLDFVASLPEKDTTITVVLISGDGTLHEIVNALYTAQTPLPSIRFVLIPGGTANALHTSFFPPPSSPAPEVQGEDSRRLASLHAFLSPTPHLTPLTLASTTLFPAESASAATPTSVISLVVASTALHASILADSEALRASHPGIERFKLAADANATTWYRARARLLPPVARYAPATREFVPVAAAELAGPFAYFLTTTNADRLEPAFRIAPLQRPGLASMDVVVVRPQRDASLAGAADEAERTRFKERLWGVLGGAYADGAHVDALYEGDGGDTVVEYFRAAGWEWEPESGDEKAHRVCADGTIFTIPNGGKAVSTVLNGHKLDLAVYA